MSDILFLRHCATDAAGTFCGHTDAPLNTAGLAHAHTLAKQFAGLKFEAVYTSDLARARSTAEALAAPHGLPVTALASLREVDFGAWEGLTWAQIEQRDPAYAARWIADFPNLTAPAGEPYADFRQRILTTEARLEREANGPIAIVTHAGPLRVVLEARCNLSPDEAWSMTKTYGCSFTLRASLESTGSKHSTRLERRKFAGIPVAHKSAVRATADLSAALRDDKQEFVVIP